MGLDSTFISSLLAHRRVALVGVAKNCGKTTTLNFLLSHLPKETVTGLLSIGIDGESHDVLLGTAKPKISVAAGQWVVTARHALKESTARVEYVESLGIETPLGQVFLGRVEEEGHIILAGLRHRQDLELALARMEAQGVEFILIDGAYGRVMGAHSEVAQGVIFSTGAVVGSSPAKILERTVALVSRWEIPVVEHPRHRALIEQAIEEDRALLGHREGPDSPAAPLALPAASALVGLSRARDLWKETTDALAVPGLVSDSIVEELLTLGLNRRTLLIPCPTSIHVAEGLWRRFTKRWDVRVLRSCVIHAISINPTSVQGHGVDGEVLCGMLAERWPGLPIFDPMGIWQDVSKLRAPQSD